MDQRLQNKAWRLTHLYKIKTKQGQLVTFKPNAIQLQHLIDRGGHRYNMTVKYRQGGVTTLYAIDLLDEALWVPGMNCALIAHEAKKLPEYFDIIKRAYENLPAEIKPKTKTDTKNKYDFTYRFDGARLDSSIYVATKLRGTTVFNLHITESAYIKDRLELSAGSKQAVPKEGRISEETTGNGFNEFYDSYMHYANLQNPTEYDYKTYFYPWQIDPQYTLVGELTDITSKEQELKDRFNLTDGQLLWRRWKMSELKKDQSGTGLSGEQLFKQEYPMTLTEAFQSGAGAVFDGEKVDAINARMGLTKDEIETKYRADYFALSPNEQYLRDELIKTAHSLSALGVSMWKLPEPDHEYVIGCDPSDGAGADNSGVDVWDKNTLEQVAQLYGKVRPDELAEIIKALAVYYNQAFVGIENNMLSTILFFTKIYDNYYYTNVVDEKTAKKTKKIGWNTNTKTRDLMIDDFLIAFDEGSLTIHSPITKAEMKTFVRKDNGKREHADGKHDDALFGGFIALQMKRFYKKTARVFSANPFS